MQENTSKEPVYGIIVYPGKVYLYWQLNMKIASMILSVQTSLELCGQTPLKFCGLFFHNIMISK